MATSGIDQKLRNAVTRDDLTAVKIYHGDGHLDDLQRRTDTLVEALLSESESVVRYLLEVVQTDPNHVGTSGISPAAAAIERDRADFYEALRGDESANRPSLDPEQDVHGNGFYAVEVASRYAGNALLQKVVADFSSFLNRQNPHDLLFRCFRIAYERGNTAAVRHLAPFAERPDQLIAAGQDETAISLLTSGCLEPHYPQCLDALLQAFPYGGDLSAELENIVRETGQRRITARLSYMSQTLETDILFSMIDVVLDHAQRGHYRINSPKPFMAAIQTTQTDVLTRLSAYGYDLAHFEKYDPKIRYEALRAGVESLSPDVVQYLVEEMGVDPDVHGDVCIRNPATGETTTSDLVTAAVETGASEIADYLIRVHETRTNREKPDNVAVTGRPSPGNAPF